MDECSSEEGDVIAAAAAAAVLALLPMASSNSKAADASLVEVIITIYYGSTALSASIGWEGFSWDVDQESKEISWKHEERDEMR